MIKKGFFAGMISLLFAIFAISCTEKEPVVEFQFDVFAEDGSDISGTQTVNFSKTITLTYKAQSLASLNVETPEGWNSEVKMSAQAVPNERSCGGAGGCALPGPVQCRSYG